MKLFHSQLCETNLSTGQVAVADLCGSAVPSGCPSKATEFQKGHTHRVFLALSQCSNKTVKVGRTEQQSVLISSSNVLTKDLCFEHWSFCTHATTRSWVSIWRTPLSNIRDFWCRSHLIANPRHHILHENPVTSVKIVCKSPVTDHISSWVNTKSIRSIHYWLNWAQSDTAMATLSRIYDWRCSDHSEC